MKIYENKHKKAFTLIELLVVIAIIGILSSVVLASLSGARESARDTRRVQDFRQLRTAVEMYRNDNENLPGASDSDGTQVSGNCSSSDLYTDLVDGGYLSNMPTDPAQSITSCDGDVSYSEPLSSSASGIDQELFYGYDSRNNGGDHCFSVNRFEGGDVPESLQGINHQPSRSFGGDSNLTNADFVYCFAG